jgi:hypothetical protein
MSQVVTASELRDRIQLKRALQTPDGDSGGFVRSYETLLELWSAVVPVTHGTYIRGVQAGQGVVTHEVTIRRTALDVLRSEFTRAFDTSFKGEDVHPLKSEFFVLVLYGGTKGSLMRVRRIAEVGVRREQLSFLCEEMEEQGTGWNNG